MKSEILIKNLPVSLYIVKCKIIEENLEFIDFQILKNVSFSGFRDEELSFETIVSNFDKDELKNFAYIIKKNLSNETFTLKCHFKSKNGKLLYFKNYIRILEIKDGIYTLLNVVTDVSTEFQLSEIFETVFKSPIIGILIYKEKNLLANETLKKFFETGDEIYNLSVIDLVPQNIKLTIMKILQRRLKGEKLSNIAKAEFKTFENKRIYLEFFADTIFYDGSYAGLAFVINKTKFYKNKIMLDMNFRVNSLIATINNEKLLLKKIENELKEINYFADIRINERMDSKYIEINNDLKKGEFKSYLYLPIVVRDKIVISYSFYSVYKDDFSEEIVSTLKEIQKDIVHALINIKHYKTLVILKNAIDKSYQWLLITDKDGKIIYVNNAVVEISGYKKEELIGENSKIFKSGIHKHDFYVKLWKTVLNGEIFNGIIVNKNKNGTLFYLKDKIIPVTIEGEIYFVSLAIDITKEKLLEEKMSSIRYMDNLTQLYNRNGFLFYGENRLKENKKLALFIIDIEDFKLLNETKSYKYGDLILQKFAKVLENLFVGEAVIARLGNDDFAVLIEFDDIKTLLLIINKIFEKIRQKKQELPININIGVSVYPKDAENIKNLIEKAYIALSFKEKSKENGFSFYDMNISSEIQKYMQAKNFVNQALEQKEFVYYFQPYVDTKTLKFYGAESLLRIKTKNEIITPDIFIDYAEKSGIIKNIEILMIKEFVETIKKFEFPLSFNLSGMSLKDEAHIQKLIDISKDYAEFITIEITERELIENLKFTKDFFIIFKNMGYKIAIDDFGTGYSSLSYISNIPIDVLKIDISFIKNLTKSKKDLIVVETIIDFAKKLNLKTVAEGVEKKEQVEILKNLGCDYLQGYYFSKPLSPDEFKKLIN